MSGVVRIGTDTVDLDKPCEVASALKKVQIRLAAGGIRETVRIDGEEITFQRANMSALKSLIAEYETACARSNGAAGQRRRYAKRVRWA